MKVKIKKRADSTTNVSPPKVAAPAVKKTASPNGVATPKNVLSSQSKPSQTAASIHGNTKLPVTSAGRTFTYKELLENIKANLEGTIKKEIKEAVTPVTREIRTVAKTATQSKSWIEKKERKAMQDQINAMRDKLIRDIMREKKVPEHHFAGVRGKLMLELRNKGIKLGLDKKQLALIKESSNKRIETLKLESFINQAIAAKGYVVAEKPPSNSPGPIIHINPNDRPSKERGNFLDTLRHSQEKRLAETAKQMAEY